jgi:hypothetical protein
MNTREEHAGARKAGAVVDQQSIGQIGRKLELSDEAGKELVAWCVPVSIESDQRLNVRVGGHRSDNLREPSPLVSDKLLEAASTVKKSPVEVEHDGLNVRSHLVRGYSIHDCLTADPQHEPRQESFEEEMKSMRSSITATLQDDVTVSDPFGAVAERRRALFVQGPDPKAVTI